MNAFWREVDREDLRSTASYVGHVVSMEIYRGSQCRECGESEEEEEEEEEELSETEERGAKRSSRDERG
jgi:hypothetical protein